jgi:cytidylate kinase
MKPLVIAVDGPAGSGKGTLARRIADHFGLDYLDSGSLYRAVASAVLARGGDPADRDAALAAARGLDPTAVDAAELRSRRVGSTASVVAEFGEVRAALIEFQRGFARRGAVIDGRDIGTVVAPDADVKLFITASLDERARRRAAELAAAGGRHSVAAIRADLAERDRRDSARAVAPLRMAEDALLLDTTDLDIEAAFQAALSLIESRLDKTVRGSP